MVPSVAVICYVVVVDFAVVTVLGFGCIANAFLASVLVRAHRLS